MTSREAMPRTAHDVMPGSGIKESEDFTKIVRIGACPVYEGSRKYSVFCKVLYKDGKLSISGVHGPLLSGNCNGGCGQIDMNFKHRRAEDDDRRTYRLVPPSDFVFAPGWDAEKWLDFLDVWARWHLNDMRPGCAHQTKLGWGKKECVMVKMQLKDAVLSAKSKLERAKDAELRREGKVQLTEDEKALMCRPFELVVPEAEVQGLMEHYTEKSRETKTSGWLRPEEHPDGVMCKPCPTCGYKYGSAWKKDAVPRKVLDFLRALPEADKQPAWV